MAWWEWDSEQQPPSSVDLDPGPVFKEGRATRIMAVGDSITRGQGAEAQGGYRKPLWDSLRSDGKTLTPVGAMGALTPVGYQAEGGWRIEDQTGYGVRNLFGWNAVDSVRLFKPDVILVALGTNNLGTGVSEGHLADYIADYRVLLDAMYAFAPRAHVFICRIVLMENQWSGTSMYNEKVQEMVEDYISKGRPYHLVLGMESMPPGSWADGLHPNKQGYDYMANIWKQALDLANTVDSD